MPEAYSTPYNFKVPVAPHPTPYSTSSFLTYSKLPSSNSAHCDKKLKPPVYNPYDKFTQHEFDAWIGNITGSLRRALGQEEDPVPPEPATTTSETSETSNSRLVSPASVEQSDWDGVEDSFAELKARRHVSNGKGKERDPLEGPGLRPESGGPHSPIEIDSASDEDEDEQAYDDEAEEAEVGREVSIDHWENTVREAAQKARVDRYGEGVQDYLEGEYTNDYDEYAVEGAPEEDQQSPSPEEISEVDSDDDIEEVQPSSPARRSPRGRYDNEGEDADEEAYSDDDVILPPRPFQAPADAHEVFDDEEEEDENEDEGRPVEVVKIDDGDETTHDNIQPEDVEADDVFPPRTLHSTPNTNDQTSSSSDHWTGPRTYAQDSYFDGEALHVPVETTSPRVAAQVLGEDGEDIAFLTPGIVTPNEGQTSPSADDFDPQNDEVDLVDISTETNAIQYQASPQIDSPDMIVDDGNIDPNLCEPVPFIPQASSMVEGVGMDALDQSLSHFLEVPTDQHLGVQRSNVDFGLLPTPPTELDTIIPEEDIQAAVETMLPDLVNAETTIAAEPAPADHYSLQLDAEITGDGALDVGIDVNVHVDIDFMQDHDQRADAGQEGLVEEAPSEGEFDVDIDESLHHKSVDVVSIRDDEPVGDDLIFGVVEEVVDEQSDAQSPPNPTDNTYLEKADLDAPQLAVVDFPTVGKDEPPAEPNDVASPFPQQVATPPSSPKLRYSQESILHTPPPVTADPNVPDPIDATQLVRPQVSAPGRSSVLSQPGVPTSLLSPVGTPGGQATPVPIPVPQSVLNTLRIGTIDGLFTPQLGSTPLRRSTPDIEVSISHLNDIKPSDSEQNPESDGQVLDAPTETPSPDVVVSVQQSQHDLSDSDNVLLEREIEAKVLSQNDLRSLLEREAVLPTDQVDADAALASDVDILPEDSKFQAPVIPAKSEPTPQDTDAPALSDHSEASAISEEPMIQDVPGSTHHLSTPPANEASPVATSPDPNSAEPSELSTPPQTIMLSRRKSTEPILLVDPFPYSLSTPGVELPGSDEDTDELDISISSNSTDSKGSYDKENDGTPSTEPDDGDQLDEFSLRYPLDPDTFPPPQEPENQPSEINEHADEPLQDKDADGEEDPDCSLKEFHLSAEVEHQDPATEACDGPISTESPHLEAINGGERPDPPCNVVLAKNEAEFMNGELRATSETDSADQSLKKSVDLQLDLRLPKHPSTPPPNGDTPSETDGSAKSCKRKRDSSTPQPSPQSSTQVRRTDTFKIGMSQSRDKGKGKARDVVGLRILNGSRPPSRSPSVTSGGDDPLMQASPTLTRQPIQSLEFDITPPPLFLAHSHSKMPKLQPNATFPHNHVGHMQSPAQLPGKILPTKAGSSTSVTPSKPLPHRTLSVSTSSPRTRSNCRFHRISLPREEGGPRVCFLVPGCSLMDRELMEDEEIEDHGDATIEDSKHMIPINGSMDFNLELIGVLRQLVGVDLLREQEVYYLPSPQERTRTLPQKTALSKITAREHDAAGAGSSSHFRRPSLDSIASSRPPNSVAHSSLSSSSSATRKRPGSDVGSSSLSSLSVGHPSDGEEEAPKRHKSTVEGDGDTTVLTTEITIRRKPLKAARRNKRIDADTAPYMPHDDEESDDGAGGKQSKTRRKSRVSSRGIKRTRTVGNDGPSPERAGKKLKLSTSQP